MSPRNIIFLAPLVICFCYFCVLFCEMIEGKMKLKACANLMPEAVELIKYLREKMLEDASWVQFDGEEKIYACDEELKRIDNFLAKLERETK